MRGRNRTSTASPPAGQRPPLTVRDRPTHRRLTVYSPSFRSYLPPVFRSYLAPIRAPPVPAPQKHTRGDRSRARPGRRHVVRRQSAVTRKPAYSSGETSIPRGAARTRTRPAKDHMSNLAAPICRPVAAASWPNGDDGQTRAHEGLFHVLGGRGGRGKTSSPLSAHTD